MSRKRIAISDNSTTLLVPQEMLEMMGVKDGDEVDVSIREGTLILRSIDEAERAKRLGEITQTVLGRRRSAYEELAKGER